MKYKQHKTLSILLLSLGCVIGLIFLGFAIFIIFISLNDFKPPLKEPITFEKNKNHDTIPLGKLELCTWNIGYCGLGKEMDFFYENGTQVKPSKELYQRYRDGVMNQITSLNTSDFVLLQEVDQESARSYNDNQVEHLKNSLNNYYSFFTLNYKVPFIPVPLTSPMGKVNSGLLTLSKYQPIEVERYSFPPAYNWPKNLFMLDRCFMLIRYNVSNGKQLVLINTHNSAFDDAADARTRELSMLKEIMIKEYNAGNYVIVGGDWNVNPVGFNADSISDGNIIKYITPAVTPDFMPEGFIWAYDPKHPTNRDVDKAYKKGSTPTTIIDFFVLSPNISLIWNHTLQHNFEFTDHQSSCMLIELK